MQVVCLSGPTCLSFDASCLHQKNIWTLANQRWAHGFHSLIGLDHDTSLMCVSIVDPWQDGFFS